MSALSSTKVKLVFSSNFVFMISFFNFMLSSVEHERSLQPRGRAAAYGTNETLSENNTIISKSLVC